MLYVYKSLDYLMVEGVNLLFGCETQSDAKQKRSKVSPLSESMTFEVYSISFAADR